MQKPINRILVPFDYSDPALHAAWIALAIARSMQASLTLFYLNLQERARRVTMVIEADSLPSLTDEIFAALLPKIVGDPSTQVLRAAFGGGLVEIASGTFSPAEEIIAYAEGNGTDLIVIGANVHSRLHDILMGSVTTEVLEHAKCSVTVVH